MMPREAKNDRGFMMDWCVQPVGCGPGRAGVLLKIGCWRVDILSNTGNWRAGMTANVRCNNEI